MPMKFLLDENIGKIVAKSLEKLGYSASRIRLIAPGIEDHNVLNLSVSRDSILITSDKDFGELIFKEGQSSVGIIFLRLQDESSDNKIKAIKQVLSQNRKIKNKFITVKEKEGKFKIRITKLNSLEKETKDAYP